MVELWGSRLKNDEVIERFLDFDVGSNSNRTLRILEDKLFSYDMVIAQREEERIKIFNPTYSPTVTTTKHINKLLRKAEERKEEILLTIEI